MRRDRFETYLFNLLRDAGHPALAAVEEYDVAGNDHVLRDVRVRGTDGITIDIRIARTAPAGGDPAEREETIVTKETPGVEVTRL